MKRRMKLIITIIIAVLIIYLPIWRFWPKSLCDLMSVEENSIKIISVSAYVFNINAPGMSQHDLYQLKDLEQQSNISQEIVDILSSSGYREDFRNLWPWGVKSISADRNYDGRNVSLFFEIENQEGKAGYIYYTTNSLISVHGMRKRGFSVYHPTNRETFDVLVEYIQEHGIKEQ